MSNKALWGILIRPDYTISEERYVPEYPTAVRIGNAGKKLPAPTLGDIVGPQLLTIPTGDPLLVLVTTDQYPRPIYNELATRLINRMLTKHNRPDRVVCGPAMLAAAKDGDFVTMTDEQMRFWCVEASGILTAQLVHEWKFLGKSHQSVVMHFMSQEAHFSTAVNVAGTCFHSTVGVSHAVRACSALVRRNVIAPDGDGYTMTRRGILMVREVSKSKPQSKPATPSSSSSR
jgi:hypothetical protein